jgi:predicted lipid-binding transport protein (Tim44 family)
MALSMDEQRILDEIERGLGSADPLLAARLSSFGFQRTALSLRTRRARVVASLATLIVVAAMSLVVYSLVPFRAVAERHTAGQSSASPRQPTLTAPHHPSAGPSASASAAAPASAANGASQSAGAAHPAASPVSSGVSSGPVSSGPASHAQ